MGIEYKLRFDFPNAASVGEFLRRLPMAREVPCPKGAFEFRTAEAIDADPMPDASVYEVPDGLAFCDYGGAGRHFLGVLIACLVSEFGQVTVTDLE